MGRLPEIVRALVTAVREQRLRALLSLGGVAWGTLAILVLLAFSVGFDELFQTRTRGLGDGIAVAWPSRTTKAWQGLPVGRPLRVTRDDVLAVGAAVPQLDAISAEFTIRETVRVGARVLRVVCSGVEAEFGALRALTPASGGRFVTPRDVEERRRVVFVGDRLAQDLFGSADAVGRELVLRDVPFVVIGVLAPKEQDGDYGSLDADRAFIPATTCGATFGMRYVDDFVFRARDPDRQADCTAAVVRALAGRLRFDPSDSGVLSVWDLTEQQRMIGYIFLAFHVVLGLAGAFTLIAGGVGIANLMFLLVRRRRAEIGLKLAVGATPRQVRAEVLAETVALVALGGAVGVGLAVAVVALAGNGPWIHETGVPRIPVALAIGCVALLAAVGIGAGWFPARAAARLEPVEALRG